MFDTELTYKDSSEDLVVIMPKALKSLLKYRQSSPVSNEAAGVLIGERRGRHIIVSFVTEPTKYDARKRYSVIRKDTHHQISVNQAFKNSNGTLDYLGEWHSHPENNPIPSKRDLSSWVSGVKFSEPMILIIVGVKGLWVAKKTGDAINELAEIISS